MIGGDFHNVLQRARCGDEQAFTELFRSLQPALRRYVHVRAPGREDDVTSDVWFEVIRGIGRFTGDGNGFRAWAFTIARNKVIDSARYEARRPTVRLDESVHTELVLDRDVADNYQDSESTKALLVLIRTLPPDQAEAVLLRTVADIDVAEVAQMLGKSPGAVRVLTHRGLRRLAGLVVETMSDEGSQS